MKCNSFVYRLEESLPELDWNKGDIISEETLKSIMRVYAEVKLTIILVQ